MPSSLLELFTPVSQYCIIKRLLVGQCRVADDGAGQNKSDVCNRNHMDIRMLPFISVEYGFMWLFSVLPSLPYRYVLSGSEVPTMPRYDIPNTAERMDPARIAILA